MAEDEDDLDNEEEVALPAPASRGSRLVRILIILAVILVSLIAVFVISYLVARSVKGSEYEENLNKTVVKSPPPLETWSFPEEFRINTADTESTHFAKLRIAMGYTAGQLGLQTELAQRVPQMQDLINLILQGKKKIDLTGQVNQLSLREEIKTQINHILREGEIKEVYFPEFIVN